MEGVVAYGIGPHIYDSYKKNTQLMFHWDYITTRAIKFMTFWWKWNFKSWDV